MSDTPAASAMPAADEPSRAFTRRIPFARHLGIELVAFGGGQSELHYTAKPEHLNTFDVTHGGAVMTLLDVTLASAARSVSPEMGVVTIEMKTSFMRPSVGPLVAKGRLIERTLTLAFTEGTIYDAKGRACAHATGTFKYVKRRLPADPAGAAEPLPLSTD
ncbi:PaaI family thioesterase [Variovorax dokdonensis]|uniref:PaaI family thioesterase n=1 Tax=Variovorax dokdonensis TaxID=344883 RepID=A0ABT7NGW1_9BURK|nr:PaaI family thioesterase [Variovorax dokdonensis]MDM0047174.1 PaaI family thioesterase [Variovorax dokdonensis]